jgi:hypothetical protein
VEDGGDGLSLSSALRGLAPEQRHRLVTAVERTGFALIDLAGAATTSIEKLRHSSPDFSQLNGSVFTGRNDKEVTFFTAGGQQTQTPASTLRQLAGDTVEESAVGALEVRFHHRLAAGQQTLDDRSCHF